ncbi:MAG: aminopeptidase P family protein [Candidatus Aminicenantes bacterium]|nr:aminopeptidase P family protein [Candidatus Aminicenantes bacterium]
MKEYESVKRLQKIMEKKDVDLVVLCPSANWVYLVPYAPISEERSTFLFISKTDVCSVIPDFDREEFVEKTGLETVFSWTDAEDPKQAVQQAWDLIASNTTREVALDDKMPFIHWKALEPHIAGLSSRLASDLLMELRIIKRPEEIEAIRTTSVLIERTLSRADEVFKEGLTEKEVEAKLKSILLEEGVDTLDYILVQAWPNSASPHHLPGSTLVKRGEPVLLDIALSHNGFFSDITRQVSIGEPTEEYKKIFSIVREAQAKAVDIVKPGIPLGDVDKAARETIAKSGFGEFFIHRIGHGLGREVHEPPSVWEGNPMLMRPGMVFTIEPGIYLPAKFGVRIEDTIAVTEQGADRLTASDRELIILS